MRVGEYAGSQSQYCFTNPGPQERNKVSAPGQRMQLEEKKGKNRRERESEGKEGIKIS